MKTVWLIMILLLLLALPTLQAADNLKAFGPAKEGMIRYVLQLAAQEDESLLRVEIIVGKMVKLDEQNRYFFGGKIEDEVVMGWGFTQYRVKELGPLGGTLMAVDPNVPKVNRFITLGGDHYLIRYNSRLPIVVYVPEGVEVRYRVWKAGGEIKKIEEG